MSKKDISPLSLKHRMFKTKRAASKYVGVYPLRESGRWRAQLAIGWKAIHLGTFDTEKEAADFYSCQLANFLLSRPIVRKLKKGDTNGK